jgi:hypothetical protein
VDDGAEAIRSAAPDGLTWTINARAAHAGELAVGKIAFVTGRCVGRVLMTKREGDNLTLVLGPVELTDIFRKLNITISQPVDLTQGINYAPPALPDKTLPLDGDDAIPPDWAGIPRAHAPRIENASFSYPAVFFRPAAYAFAPQNSPQTPGILPKAFKLQMQTLTPLNNADGVGMEFGGEKYGLRAAVQAQLRLNQPSLEFSLGINNGQVNATLILHNAAGLKLAFDSAVDEGGPRNITWYSPAGSISFPVSGPVPLAFDVRQELFLEAQFMSGSSSFSAGGNYDFNADIGFTYQNKQFNLVAPKGLTVRKAIMDNMTGVAIAPRRFAFRHAITVTAGLGGAGFTIGPQLILGTRIEVKEGGDTGIVQCKGATLTMGVKGGVGWTIPRPIAKVVNFFLNLVQVKPIQDHGGIHTDWKYWLNQQVQTGGAICGAPGG